MKCLIKEKLSAHKYKDNNGYLICVDSVLARTGKQTYLRSEIFADAADDNSEIEVDRKPEEVFSEKTLASFENCPICVEHPDEDVNPENYKEYAVGFVRDVHKGIDDGKEVILGTLVITDAKTIEEIENGEHTDLSCGYDCDIDDSAHPQQRNIRGNHVALCEQGRAGNARIVDSVKDDLVFGYTDLDLKKAEEMLAKAEDEKEKKLLQDLIAKIKFELKNKEYKEEVKDMPYNGQPQVKEKSSGFAIVLKSRWNTYKLNAGIEAWENSLEAAKIHKDKLEYQDRSNCVIINCSTKTLVQDSVKDVEPHAGESKEDFIARFMKETKEEYPDEKQRLAVAYSYWEKKDMKDALNFDRIAECDFCGEKTKVAITHYGTSHYNRLICKECAEELKPKDSVKDETYNMVQKDGLLYLKREDGKLIGPFYTMKEACEYVKIKWNDSVKDDDIDILSKKYDVINRSNVDEFLRDFNKLYNRHLSADGGDIVNENYKDVYNVNGAGVQVEYLVKLLKNSVRDEKIIQVTLEGKTYKAIYNGMSSRYPDMADVYIPELVSYYSNKYTPADDLGNHPKDGKYYIKKDRIYMRDEETTAERVTKKLEKGFESFKESRMKDDKGYYTLLEFPSVSEATEFKNSIGGNLYHKDNSLKMICMKTSHCETERAKKIIKELNGKIAGYSNGPVSDSVKDAKLTYFFRYKDLYHNEVHSEEIKANSVNEAIEELRRRISLRGIGTANVYVNHIDIKETGEYYPFGYGKLNVLTIDSKKLIDAVKIAKLSKIIKNKK